MDSDELLLYETFGNYALSNLFWCLTYINNAAFNTPMKEDTKAKLMALNKTYETIMKSIYPADQCRELVDATANDKRIFIAYIDHLLQGSSQTAAIKQKWKEGGLHIATLLNSLNPYWKIPEWSAMITHENDLLDTIATNIKSKNYSTFINAAPICRRLAVDMSKYMSMGISLQQQDSW